MGLHAEDALMPPAGSISLGQVAAHTEVLIVACSRCERVERYRLKTLIARHGPAFPVPDLLRRLSEGCPKRTYDLCGIHCPELSQFLMPQTY
jgi:hypothetical protein